jgi:hypothetical protein
MTKICKFVEAIILFSLYFILVWEDPYRGPYKRKTFILPFFKFPYTRSYLLVCTLTFIMFNFINIILILSFFFFITAHTVCETDADCPKPAIFDLFVTCVDKVCTWIL